MIQKIKGKTLEEAKVLYPDLEFRVTFEDDINYIITDDLKENRIDVKIVNGKIK